MPLKDFNETYRSELSDPEFRVAYLEAAMEEAVETGDAGMFLVALREVLAAVNQPFSDIAARQGKSRTSLYKTLSGKSSPRFDSVLELLPEAGVRLRIELIPQEERELVAA